jgi:hypothetical protein
MPPYELTPSDSGLPAGLSLNIDPTRDTYVIKGAGGVAVAHVRKPDGQVYSARVQANGALQQFTHFNPNRLTVGERRTLENTLYTENNLKQTEIADLLGVSQATVANDLKLIRNSSQTA